jgi:hypothetical protein
MRSALNRNSFWTLQSSSNVAAALAYGCCVASLLLTDFLTYSASGAVFELSFSELVSHCIWLAPIPAVFILRRIHVATAIYALLLLAVLIARIVDIAKYLVSGFLPKLTLTDVGAYAIAACSMFVVLMWIADWLTQLLFNLVKAIFEALRNR